MVKFQKQLEAQLVPQWQEAYCNYKQLKREIRRINHELLDASHSLGTVSSNSFAARFAIMKLLRSPLSAIPGRFFTISRLFWSNVEDIMVHLRQIGPSEGEAPDELYETEVLSEVIPLKLATDFFKTLDEQLNMVNRFYKLKEEEFSLRAHSLQLQMASLLDSRRESLGYELIHSHGTDRGKSRSGLDSKVWDQRYALDLCLSKDKEQIAEKQLRTAFIAFYSGLGQLKSFSAVNMMAFAKIMKKYDKVTGCYASLTYCKVVESSYFASSDKLLHLMDSVEDLFTQHLAHQNHKHAMVYLRPLQQPSTYLSISYFQGLFTGSSLTLFAMLVLILVLPNTRLISDDHSNSSLRGSLPIFSTMGLLLLHLHVYGWNMYLWNLSRINYAPLFELNPRIEIRCQEVLLVSGGLTTVWMSVLIFLTAYPGIPNGELIPAVLLLVFLAVLFLPLDICRGSMRLAFLRCIGHIISSPFNKVVFADFFLADQLCSQAAAIKNFQYICCYYIGGYFSSQDVEACSTGRTYHSIQYLVCMLPYWWRLMQCARRWIDERDIKQVMNGGKYLSALLTSLLKVAYVQREGTISAGGSWLILFVISATVSTIYNLYWDIVMDWGLLQSNSVNPWLRDRLILRHKCIYYFSMVLNTLLRMAWLAALLHVPQGVGQEIEDILLAILEVFRRGHWNFYRLEYEHILKFFGKVAPSEDLEGGSTLHEI